MRLNYLFEGEALVAVKERWYGRPIRLTPRRSQVVRGHVLPREEPLHEMPVEVSLDGDRRVHHMSTSPREEPKAAVKSRKRRGERVEILRRQRLQKLREHPSLYFQLGVRRVPEGDVA